MSKMTIFSLVIPLLIFFQGVDSLKTDGIQCLDESGNPVDWLILYKLPNSLKKPKRDPLEGDYLSKRMSTQNINGQTKQTNITNNLANDDRKFVSKDSKKNLLQLGQVCSISFWPL
jgi:hypothetical protein